jgi:hypothetical protein
LPTAWTPGRLSRFRASAVVSFASRPTADLPSTNPYANKKRILAEDVEVRKTNDGGFFAESGHYRGRQGVFRGRLSNGHPFRQFASSNFSLSCGHACGFVEAGKKCRFYSLGAATKWRCTREMFRGRRAETKRSPHGKAQKIAKRDIRATSVDP